MTTAPTMPDRLLTVIRRAWGWHDAPHGTCVFLLSGALEGLSLVTVRLAFHKPPRLRGGQ